MALEDLILEARPDLELKEIAYTIRSLEETLFGKRGIDDDPRKDLEGYAGFAGGEEM